MKFPLIHTGRRFFFFTFVVEGRMPVLSRLVRGAKRPVLLPAGERIADMAARASTSDGGRRPPNPLAPASATGGSGVLATGGSGVVATGGSGMSPVVRKEGAR